MARKSNLKFFDDVNLDYTRQISKPHAFDEENGLSVCLRIVLAKTKSLDIDVAKDFAEDELSL